MRRKSKKFDWKVVIILSIAMVFSFTTFGFADGLFGHMPEYKGFMNNKANEIIDKIVKDVVIREQKWRIEYDKKTYDEMKKSNHPDQVSESWESFKDKKYKELYRKEWNKQHFFERAWRWIWSIENDPSDSQLEKWYKEIGKACRDSMNGNSVIPGGIGSGLPVN
jgi:hypothetical protein